VCECEGSRVLSGVLSRHEARTWSISTRPCHLLLVPACTHTLTLKHSYTHTHTHTQTHTHTHTHRHSHSHSHSHSLTHTLTHTIAHFISQKVFIMSVEFIPQKVCIKSLCRSQFPHKSVKLSFFVTPVKNKLTILCGYSPL
jgi:ABC-type Zn2+ transport system substrate-binding protein/surface adhesin